MKRWVHPFVLSLVILAGVMAFAGGGRSYHFSKTVILPVTTAGDTAQVTTKMPVVAVDSFVYIDSFSYQADTTAHKTITWLSPLQVMRFTPGIVDSSTVIACSIAFAATTLGFTVDPADAYITVAKICDTLTSLFNVTAGLTDSVTAYDSGTYVKVVSNWSQKKHTSRWSSKFVMTGGTGTLDTSSTITTKAMICDSMVAAINASANLDSFLTAAVSAAETTYTTTSDDAGVLFWDSSKNDPDTFATVTRTQANVTSSSRRYDTLDLFTLIDDQHRPAAIYGNIIIHPSTDTGTGNGLGESDSGWLKLAVFSLIDTNKSYIILHADSAAVLPCTLHIARIYAAANDSLFRQGAALVWGVSDTLSDDIFPAYYRISIDLNVLDH